MASYLLIGSRKKPPPWNDDEDKKMSRGGGERKSAVEFGSNCRLSKIEGMCYCNYLLT